MKKVMLLFMGAVASFLVLAYIDEYENLVRPFLSPEKGPPVLAGTEKTVEKVIRGFNDILEKAYLASDPSLLNSSLLDSRLEASIAEDIEYLKKEGKVMELRVKDSEVNKVEMIPPQVVRVSAKETLGVRYLSADKDKEIVLPDGQYEVVYMLSRINGTWRVISYETKGFELKGG